MISFFEILTLVAIVGVISAFKLILSEHKRKKAAQAKWEKFQKEHPKPKTESTNFKNKQ